jgi:ATP-dependent helicase/nuclease subunit B
LLLPRLQPIGEPDEAELLLDPEIELDLPPAIPPLRRRLLLTRLILAREEITYEQAVRLAGELESFLDEVQTEEVDLAGLDGLVPEELAEHWQETLRFLRILKEAWPGVLEAEGALDPAVRRNRLLQALARTWSDRPPPHPVIAAGMTGSVPAVSALLAVVAALPHGRVVLPGLDRELDERSWASLPANHAQHGLKRLLDRLNLDRAVVTDWPHGQEEGGPPARVVLWREAMRPAETTERWLGQPIAPEALAGLTLVEARDLAGEASHVALRMREALETPGKRAVLITPDRNLGRRVAAELLRWGIRVDDSAGVPLDQSPPGSFLLLTAHLVTDDAPPVTLLSALKHPLASGGLGQRDFRRYVRALERGILRGPRIAGGLDGLRAALADSDGDDAHWRAPVPRAELLAWLERLVEAGRPFLALVRGDAAPMRDLLDAHLAFAEALAADAEGDPRELWAKEAGSVARDFVAELREASDLLPEITPSAYPALLAVLMGTRSVRPRRTAHPRLGILGRLEARLVQADLVLVGGLVEGVWPPQVEGGPWLNRLMRRRMGLPPVEQEIGFAAHDLLLASCAAEVVLTTSAKDETGTPRTPSRWVARLVAVLKAANLRDAVAPDPCWQAWVDELDRPHGPPIPAPRPEPRPPVAIRPRELWATDVEKLMRDPYSVYARRILKLEPLEALDADPGGAERGELVHRALQMFVRRWDRDMPNDALEQLRAIGRELFLPQEHRPQVMAIWWPRFVRVAEWFVELERRRRAEIDRIATEIRGLLELEAPGGTFRIRARADRVEIGRDDALTIVDYKTGGVPANGHVRLGLSPQLPIEALIAASGGFDGLPGERAVTAMLFWQLKGGEPAGAEIDPAGRDAEARILIERAREGLARLIAHFDDPETAYLPIPRPEIAPGYNDYEHLARKAEWWGSEEPAK